MSQMMGLAAAASDPAAGSFVVPPGQKQAHIRFGPEPSPLKRSDIALTCPTQILLCRAYAEIM